MSKRKRQSKAEKEYWKDFESRIEFKDFNNWEERLKMTPIHGLRIDSYSDLISFFLTIDEPNSFDGTSSDDAIYY